MPSIFCPDARLVRLQRKQQALSAVLATLASPPADSSAESYVTTFRANYDSDEQLKITDKRLGKALKHLAEGKRRDECKKKLERKNEKLEKAISRQSSISSTSTTSSRPASSTTLVDSSDEEKEGKSSEEDGVPLELTWTWSAMGEAF